jgi:hypothetical protein
MSNPPRPCPAIASTGQSRTYRINTGKVAFVPFTANSIDEATEYIRQNQNPHYAGRRWLQVLENGVFVWVT